MSQKLLTLWSIALAAALVLCPLAQANAETGQQDYPVTNEDLNPQAEGGVDLSTPPDSDVAVEGSVGEEEEDYDSDDDEDYDSDDGVVGCPEGGCPSHASYGNSYGHSYGHNYGARTRGGVRFPILGLPFRVTARACGVVVRTGSHVRAGSLERREGRAGRRAARAGARHGSACG